MQYFCSKMVVDLTIYHFFATRIHPVVSHCITEICSTCVKYACIILEHLIRKRGSEAVLDILHGIDILSTEHITLQVAFFFGSSQNYMAFKLIKIQ